MFQNRLRENTSISTCQKDDDCLKGLLCKNEKCEDDKGIIEANRHATTCQGAMTYSKNYYAACPFEIGQYNKILYCH
jgi:hypothetical protein